jgi:hypothetical protein
MISSRDGPYINRSWARRADVGVDAVDNPSDSTSTKVQRRRNSIFPSTSDWTSAPAILRDPLHSLLARSDRATLYNIRRRFTAESMRSAAAPIDSCSHIRTTSQPANVSFSSVSRSRATLASIFARHHSPLFFGQVPCCGHPCQKHPSMNTAVRDAGKTISTVRRVPTSRR